jgi:hypothetical protein
MQPLWWRRKMNQIVWLLLAILLVHTLRTLLHNGQARPLTPPASL